MNSYVELMCVKELMMIMMTTMMMVMMMIPTMMIMVMTMIMLVPVLLMALDSYVDYHVKVTLRILSLEMIIITCNID